MSQTTSIDAADLFKRITDAGSAIRPQVLVTPLYPSVGLANLTGAQVLLKAEHLQPTGSFKLRGAMNKLRLLGSAERGAGVVTASSGNHGLAVAKAGADLGVPVTVYVADSASPVKTAAIRAFGATLVTVTGPGIDAELRARERGEQTGQVYVSPYNDLDVIAGQGTIGLELADQCGDLDALFVSVGGGGLISGIGSALKGLQSSTRVIGVWPENSPCLLRALEAGKVVDVVETDTISDGTAGGVEEGSVTLPIAMRVIDETITVNENEIKAAMRHIAETERWLVEGAAGVALAGLLKCAPQYQGKRVAAVLCGRNIAFDKFLAAIRR